jgi:serine/threonine protein kinase
LAWERWQPSTSRFIDVLVEAHAHGIVRRDINPDNLFVLTQGHLKVLDFGIARMKEGAPGTLHTKTGMAMGTITYMLRRCNPR